MLLVTDTTQRDVTSVLQSAVVSVRNMCFIFKRLLTLRTERIYVCPVIFLQKAILYLKQLNET